MASCAAALLWSRTPAQGADALAGTRCRRVTPSGRRTECSSNVLKLLLHAPSPTAEQQKKATALGQYTGLSTEPKAAVRTQDTAKDSGLLRGMFHATRRAPDTKTAAEFGSVINADSPRSTGNAKAGQVDASSGLFLPIAVRVSSRRHGQTGWPER